MLEIGRTHFENVRNHLATHGIIPRVHGNVKRGRDGKPKQGYNANCWFANENFERVYLINRIYCGDRGALLRFRINMHSQRSRDNLDNFRPLK
jgi:hypothetical protein